MPVTDSATGVLAPEARKLGLTPSRQLYTQMLRCETGDRAWQVNIQSAGVQWCHCRPRTYAMSAALHKIAVGIVHMSGLGMALPSCTMPNFRQIWGKPPQ